MKFKAKRRFGLIQDTREVECPFFPGIFFTLRRPGHPAVREWGEKMQRESPISQQYAKELKREQTRLAMKGKTAKKKERDEMVDRVLDRVDFDVQFDYLTIALERVIVHIEDWRGVELDDDTVVPFSAEAAKELFQSPELMPLDAPFGVEDPDVDEGETPPPPEERRRTLGGAFVAWVLDEIEHEERWAEDLGKNSEPSSAGDTAPSAG